MFHLHLNYISLLLCCPALPAFTVQRPSNDQPHSFVADVADGDAQANPYANIVLNLPQTTWRDALLIGVNSKFDNVWSRNLHRRSWMQHNMVKSGIVHGRFLLAGNSKLHEDDVKAGDCIRLPVPENFQNLTAKTLAFFEWYKKNSNARYVMKLDDDSYPHLDGLLRLVKGTKNKLSYMGFPRSGAVRRSGSHAETKFQGDVYPPYMMGPAYVLSRELVDEITTPSLSHATYDNEDTTVGIRVDMFNARHDRSVQYVSLPGTVSGCYAGDVISMNWDARQFPCVFDAEKMAKLRNQVQISKCCDLPFGHWKDSASVDENFEPELFIGVNSKFDNVLSRNLHRQAWMQHNFVKNGIVQVRFLLAGKNTSLGNTTNTTLHADDLKAGDCIQLPVPEDYHQLTEKTLAFLEWYKKNSNAHYVMKLDDDSYPHLDGLLPFIQNTTSQLSYMGFEKRGPVLRTGKWAETKFKGKRYPPYMQGPAYVLSRHLVNEIMKPSFSREKYDNENTTVGIRVDELQSQMMTRHRTVQYVRLPGTLWGCRRGDVISLNWDARQFSCVFEVEKSAKEAGEIFPNATKCCGKPASHWKDSAEGEEEEPTE